jgi:ADP-ribose pyrophosphatase YjhB (NUDIX family)
LTDYKEEIARLVRRPPFNRLLTLGVRLFVPRQRVGVALVTFNSDEEVLLLRHVFHTQNPWGLPGGWLARNEAPPDGLRREIREELALGVTLGPLLQLAHESVPPHLVVAFLGRLDPGPMRLNSEIIEARWFGRDNLPQPLWPFATRAIDAGLTLWRANANQVAVFSREAEPA